MKFKEFWKKGYYINRVTVDDIDGNRLYDGFGKRLKVSEFEEYEIEQFSIERSTLMITVVKGEA